MFFFSDVSIPFISDMRAGLFWAVDFLKELKTKDKRWSNNIGRQHDNNNNYSQQQQRLAKTVEWAQN